MLLNIFEKYIISFQRKALQDSFTDEIFLKDLLLLLLFSKPNKANIYLSVY